MEIREGKITEISEKELYDYWLQNWSDFYDYSDYHKRMEGLGVVITND